MWIFAGYAIIIVAVLGGFMLSGGHVAALIQPYEFLIIGGAAAGAFLVGNGIEVTKRTWSDLRELLRPSPYSSAFQVRVLALLYELMVKAHRDGLLMLEKEIDEPDESPLFRRYPDVLQQRDVLEILADYFRLMITGTMDRFQLEGAMDSEIEMLQEEAMVPSHALSRLGDALPGFGIVAAVLGVVHTMESVGLPPEELGVLIARALVGTFLGILLAYGFVGPLANLLEHRALDKVRVLNSIKGVLIAYADGNAPIVSVEYGRKALYSHERPSFLDLEKHIKEIPRLAA